MGSSKIKETDLYGPVKTFLEGQGYTVKSEVGPADVVAVRGEEEPVIVELKTRFSLALIHQAIERQGISDAVYIAVPSTSTQGFYKSLQQNFKLCRRLGLGLLTVGAKTGGVQVHVDPAPYRPRKSKARKGRLLAEFQKRVGDPNQGGSTRERLVTAYRQDALRCLRVLHRGGASKAAEVAAAARVPRAARVMYDNHYGWFERVRRGVYDLSPKGEEACEAYARELETLGDDE